MLGILPLRAHTTAEIGMKELERGWKNVFPRLNNISSTEGRSKIGSQEFYTTEVVLNNQV